MRKHNRLPAALLSAALVINSCVGLVFADDEPEEQVVASAAEQEAEESSESEVKAEPADTDADGSLPEDADSTEAVPADEEDAEEAEPEVIMIPMEEETVKVYGSNDPDDETVSTASGEVRRYDADGEDDDGNYGYEKTVSHGGGTGPMSGKHGVGLYYYDGSNKVYVTDTYGIISFVTSPSKTVIDYPNAIPVGNFSYFVEASIESGYVLLTYYVINNSNSDTEVTIGSIADIALNGDDKIPMTVSGSNLLAYDRDNNVALAVVPDSGSLNTRWLGEDNSTFSQFTNDFSDSPNTTFNTGSSKSSAGMAWSLKITAAAGTTTAKSVRLYMGDLNVCKITYNGNGGTGTMDDQVVYGDRPADLLENTFTRTDHKFKGWSTSSTATTPDYKDKDSISGLTGDVTLYAVWQENPIPTITADDVELTYGDNGGAVDATTTGDGALSFEVSESDDVITVDAATGDITILKAGDAKIKISSAATDNYRATSKTIDVTVNKKPVDITINDASKDWGEEDPSFTFTSADQSCSFEGTPEREEGEDVGEYKINAGSIAVARGSTTNYTLGKVTKGKFTINEVSVDVTIDYCDGEAPEVVPSSASIPLKVYLERKADSKTYEGRTIVGWYTDADYTTEYDSSVPLGKTPIKLYAKWGDVSYSFTEGEDSVWTQGSDEGLTFKASRNVGDEFTFGHFKGVKVDGDELDASDYTAESGSVIVTLGVDFLTDLDVGTHTITLMFDDADDIEASFKVKAAKEDEDDDDDDEDTDDSEESAQTGDSASPIILIAAAILVAGGAVAVFFALKKRPEKN